MKCAIHLSIQRKQRRIFPHRGAVFGSVLRPERVAEEARTQQGRDMINHGLFNLIQAKEANE